MVAGKDEALIHHVALPEDWAKAKEAGTYRRSTRGRSLEEEGFIHCAYPDQIDGVLQRFYADIAGPLLRLDIDPARLASPVVAEPPAPGLTELFPHIYGPIDLDAVVEVHPLTPPFHA